MSVGQACLWGLLGVALVQIHELWTAATTPNSPRWPWRNTKGRLVWAGYTVAAACRIAMAAGLNAIYADAHQIDGPLAAVTMGIAAPLIIKQWAARPTPTPALTEYKPPQPALDHESHAFTQPPMIEQSSGGIDAH